MRAVLTVYADGNDGGTLEKDILEPVEKKRSYLSAAAMIVQGAENWLVRGGNVSPLVKWLRR